MDKLENVAILMICAILAGCGSAFQISHQAKAGGKSVRLDGIPFYTKAVACKHETIWLKQTFKVTLAAIPKLGDSQMVSKEISRDLYLSDKFKAFIKQVHERNSNKKFDHILKQFKEFKEFDEDILPSGSSSLFTKDFILVNNQKEPYTYIDYTHPHYYNARIPLAGSVNASADLSPELTLSKASSNVQEQTLKTFLDLLPVKEVLSGAAKAVIGISPETEVEIRLTIEPLIYKYTFSMIETADALPCGNPQTLLIDPQKANFYRTVMSEDESKKKEKETEKPK